MRTTFNHQSLCNWHIRSRIQKFMDNGRVLVREDSLVKPQFDSIAKSRAIVPMITVENERGEILNECTGFTIDSEGFILAPEYLSVPKTQDRNQSYKLYATFTTLGNFLPKVSDEHIVCRYGVEGVVKIKVPLIELYKDGSKDLALLKIDLPYVQDEWSKVSYEGYKLRPGNSTYIVSQNTVSEGQMMHHNTNPESSFITTNNINRNEIGSPCLDSKGKIVGMSSRICYQASAKAQSLLKMILGGSFPSRLLCQLTYVVDYFSINNFLREQTGIEFQELNNRSLMSSNAVKQRLARSN